MQRPIEINGKFYPLWSQFVRAKDEWIGGELVDYGDSFDRATGYHPSSTGIVDVALEPNGEKSAIFRIIGERFECAFDVEVGGISGEQEKEPWLVFAGYGGQKFKIRKNEAGVPKKASGDETQDEEPIMPMMGSERAFIEKPSERK